jgi:hypothetical protein
VTDALAWAAIITVGLTLQSQFDAVVDTVQPIPAYQRVDVTAHGRTGTPASVTSRGRVSTSAFTASPQRISATCSVPQHRTSSVSACCIARHMFFFFFFFFFFFLECIGALCTAHGAWRMAHLRIASGACCVVAQLMARGARCIAHSASLSFALRVRASGNACQCIGALHTSVVHRHRESEQRVTHQRLERRESRTMSCSPRSVL